MLFRYIHSHHSRSRSILPLNSAWESLLKTLDEDSSLDGILREGERRGINARKRVDYLHYLHYPTNNDQQRGAPRGTAYFGANWDINWSVARL